MTSEGEIDAALVHALVSEQFPQWSDLPVKPVETQGWDNRTFRLGDSLSVRLPSADGYVPGLMREERTLATLAPRLQVTIPRVIATGAPSAAFGRPWSVRPWIEGQTLATVAPGDRISAITGLAASLAELQACSTEGGHWPGYASAYRGCHVSVLGEDVQRALADLPALLAQECRMLWQAAVSSVWAEPPVWVHGDVSPGNVLFDETGRLAALIDFGQTCVGDPACDLAFAWLSCDSTERGEFRERLSVPDDAWRRGAVWALWKALISSKATMATTYGRDRLSVIREVAALSRNV